MRAFFNGCDYLQGGLAGCGAQLASAILRMLPGELVQHGSLRDIAQWLVDQRFVAQGSLDSVLRSMIASVGAQQRQPVVAQVGGRLQLLPLAAVPGRGRLKELLAGLSEGAEVQAWRGSSCCPEQWTHEACAGVLAGETDLLDDDAVGCWLFCWLAVLLVCGSEVPDYQQSCRCCWIASRPSPHPHHAHLLPYAAAAAGAAAAAAATAAAAAATADAGSVNPANLTVRGQPPSCVEAALAIVRDPQHWHSAGQYWQTGLEQLRFLQQGEYGARLKEGVVSVSKLTSTNLAELNVYLYQDCPLRLALEEHLRTAGKVGGCSC